LYFKLILENGHVGSGKSLERVRYFRGENPVDVFNTAARLPRVKGKDRGTGVKIVQAVSKEEYIKGVRQCAGDRYHVKRKRKKHSKRNKEVLFH